MGFSVTAAHVVFAFALLTAGSAALGSYWKTQDALEEGRRVAERRAVDAANTALAFVGSPVYAPIGGVGRISFTIENTGSTVLEYEKFEYLFDGVIKGAMADDYPRLNGSPSTTSLLLLPGDTLDVRLEGIGSNPTRIQVVAENGVSAIYS